MTHTPTCLCIYLVFRISQHVSENISETFIYPTSISKKERFRSHNVYIFKHLMYIRHEELLVKIHIFAYFCIDRLHDLYI